MNKYVTWFLVLKDGREIPFYMQHKDSVRFNEPGANPLTSILDFDCDEFWSVDIGDKHGFKPDPKDDSFYLVPKQDVVRVYYK